MALIFKAVGPIAVVGPQSGFSWDAWYEKNKQRLNEKKAKRYREDPAYRDAILTRSRAKREQKMVVTDGHTISFNDAAERLGITMWVLREWRRKNYFPEPFRRNGRMWFTPHQLQLLERVQQFFAHHGSRVSEIHRSDLDNLTSLTYSNW